MDTQFTLVTAVALAAAWTRPDARAPEAYEVDRGRSYIYAVTHRAGLLGFLGHEHAILATDWHGQLCHDPDDVTASSAAFEVATPSLVIDADSARALAGLGSGPGEDDVAEIQRKLLDPERLAADAHPVLRFRTTAASAREDGGLRLRGVLTIRGVEREVSFPVELERQESGVLRLSGTFEVKQRDYGIQPESVAGVVNVANEVDIHVLLVAVPTGRACAPSRATLLSRT